MSEDSDEHAAQRRRRRLREALDDYAPDPLTVADQGGDAASSTPGRGSPESKGLSEEDLKREVPPHHGS